MVWDDCGDVKQICSKCSLCLHCFFFHFNIVTQLIVFMYIKICAFIFQFYFAGRVFCFGDADTM